MNQEFYYNPVLPGFFPDPSIVRVGDDYYMVNSTFQFFPAIIISHSKDLVNWRQIGHGITNPEYLDLSVIEESWGVWAPDISYHEGTYYIFFTVIKRDPVTKKEIICNYSIKSQKPEGPYSRPALICRSGIDPSHFIDDDGTHYMVTNPVRITKMDSSCTKAEGEPIIIWEGTGLPHTEGPHILKKDGYYYLIVAEGGTSYEHRVCVARSKNLYGPYEECPFNPVLMQTDRSSKIQKAGHGKLVQTQKGEWWMAYLCGRPLGDGFCVLGRETCLDRVRWTDDGWFIVNNGRPGIKSKRPDLPKFNYEFPYFDDFNSKILSPVWQFVRSNYKDLWSLDERESYLRLYCSNMDLDTLTPQALILQRERSHNYCSTVKMEFEPQLNMEQAGLVCYYDKDAFIKFCVIYIDGEVRLKVIKKIAQKIENIAQYSAQVSNKIHYLRIVTSQLSRRFYYSNDNVQWVLVASIEDAGFLSDESVAQATGRWAFTGTMTGIYAYNGGSGRKIYADFDWFCIEDFSIINDNRCL